MKTSLLVASIAAGLTLAGAAVARDAQPPRMELPAFEEIDLNGDGAVTTDEIEAAREAMATARFEQADTDGDGALSAEELVAAAQSQRAERMETRAARMIERMDANDDGVLQPDEMQMRGAAHGAERMFERADANDDGALSAEEYDDAQARMAERGGRGGRNGHGEGRRHN